VVLALGPGDVLGELDAKPEASAPATPGRTAPPTPMFSLAAPADPDGLVAPGSNFSAWTLLDRATGEATGSSNAGSERNTVESMIKPWLAADYLRLAAESGETPSETPSTSSR
jgi:hypothetical protein